MSDKKYVGKLAKVLFIGVTLLGLAKRGLWVDPFTTRGDSFKLDQNTTHLVNGSELQTRHNTTFFKGHLT
jgi:hypothetical protein